MPEVVRTQRPYQGRIVQVRVDEVRREDGRAMLLEVVEHAPSVGIVPLRDDGQVVLIRQYRHATGESLLEIPAGSVDPGETGAECAQRELAEEIGCRAGTIERLGGFYLCPGYLNEFMEIFLARHLTPAQGTPDDDEQIDLAEMPLAEALRRSAGGELRDAKTVAALAMAAAHLGI
jgi:ADP-ribose pyrophosphatase